MSRRPLFPPVFAPLVSHPLVDDFSVRAQRQRASVQPPGVASMYPLPLRNHPMWSGNNELGFETPFAADANNRQMVLKLGEWGEPAVWTAMLGMAYNPAGLSVTSFFDVVAEVQAGVGGAMQEFEVDWCEGTQFSCPMNALNVTAKYYLVSGVTPTLEVPSDLKLRVTLGRKPFTNASPPTRSLLTESVPAGQFTTEPLIIPKFARRLTPISAFGLSEPYAATTSYLWQNNPSIPSTIGGFTGAEFLTGFGANGIPIPSEARAIIVANNGAIANRVKLVFHLAL
ncbi:MAG TPA: hypothetical protein VGK73_04115 [Polyangiaceae bacterium]